MKRVVILSGLLGLMAWSATIPAHAVPLVINTEINGECYYYMTTEYDHIYRCENGALEYIRRNPNGHPGGGDDGGDGGGDPIDG